MAASAALAARLTTCRACPRPRSQPPSSWGSRDMIHAVAAVRGATLAHPGRRAHIVWDCDIFQMLRTPAAFNERLLLPGSACRHGLRQFASVLRNRQARRSRLDAGSFRLRSARKDYKGVSGQRREFGLRRRVPAPFPIVGVHIAAEVGRIIGVDRRQNPTASRSRRLWSECVEHPQLMVGQGADGQGHLLGTARRLTSSGSSTQRTP